MTKTYRPVFNEETIVRFSRGELETALTRLRVSGAQEIGIPVRLEEED